MSRILVAALLAGALVSAAQGAEQTLGRRSMSSVFVWKDSASHSEALKLIAAGVYDTQPALVLQLLSCIATPGDKAVVIESGWASSTVLITGGDQVGCRGVVAKEDLRN